MSEDHGSPGQRSRRFGHGHKPKPLRNWVIPLLVAVAIIIFLPRLLALLE